ncbi:unnamed protein product [Acanthoscelides obtectus]|uniref:C-type lectin domain-containing protein n=2 Tax=Acanthoscelides obtectus TaxID=200917 RepID=A0A9P0JRT0_ACAOB|nr:unnamed protein product [Acanthoscelides obtectus]CAK1668123.1 hypothetical protein AOBTE_LOCUS26242 [Acanthoscelides obtectus]
MGTRVPGLWLPSVVLRIVPTSLYIPDVFHVQRQFTFKKSRCDSCGPAVISGYLKTRTAIMKTLMVIAALCAVSKAQFPNGRILEPPVPALCAQRVIHERTPDGKGYFFSWRDPATKNTELDWLDGRNFCRKRCMDLVSLETSAENEWIKKHIVDDKVKYIWTSGRLCDFAGCERADLQPPRVNGWFWTAVLQKLAPTTRRDQNDWSESGGIGRPQPDNREEIQGGAPENCVAVLNQFYNDGKAGYCVM